MDFFAWLQTIAKQVSDFVNIPIVGHIIGGIAAIGGAIRVFMPVYQDWKLSRKSDRELAESPSYKALYQIVSDNLIEKTKEWDAERLHLNARIDRLEKMLYGGNDD